MVIFGYTSGSPSWGVFFKVDINGNYLRKNSIWGLSSINQGADPDSMVALQQDYFTITVNSKQVYYDILDVGVSLSDHGVVSSRLLFFIQIICRRTSSWTPPLWAWITSYKLMKQVGTALLATPVDATATKPGSTEESSSKAKRDVRFPSQTRDYLVVLLYITSSMNLLLENGYFISKSLGATNLSLMKWPA